MNDLTINQYITLFVVNALVCQTLYIFSKFNYYKRCDVLGIYGCYIQD